MVFAVEQQQQQPIDVSGSESMSSSSNQSGSDVVVASNEPYSSVISVGEEVSDTSEEGSVEVVMDKVMRLASMTDYSVSPLNANGSNFNTKSTGKSLSSRSQSSKSSSQASHKKMRIVSSSIEFFCPLGFILSPSLYVFLRRLFTGKFMR